ncbi:hypothetical protein BKA66DRAFT_419577 [Pyrenochaeta sp. MPI-SDFR-AT-0127]|nr:hypothetical protein BKA66DRAFT_419577 [Pyrenochaeta sp. MPI-SDFR-AT-0127]
MGTPARVVEAFAGLQTNDSRLQALHALLPQLTPYEWRKLHALTSARSFHCDIIGQLPIELVAHIFAYLDTSSPYRLQCVSRRWSRTLRSLHVLKQSLNHWYQHTVDLSTADHAVCEQKARRIHAFRNGKPRCCFKFYPADDMPSPILTGDFLVWLSCPEPPHLARLVYMFNLKSWTLRSVSGEAREHIRAIYASDHLVVMTTSRNICYVSTLSGHGQKKFRVPSNSFFNTVACRGRTVACASSHVDHISIYVWDYDTKCGKSFQIVQNPSHHFFNKQLLEFIYIGHEAVECLSLTRIRCTHRHDIALLLQPDTKTIVVFGDIICSKEVALQLDTCDNMPGPIIYSRFTYDGVCLNTSHGSWKLLGSVQLDASEFVPVDHNGRFATRIKGKRSVVLDVQTYVQFDEQLNKFIAISDASSQFTAWWKDTCYGLGPTEQHSEPHVILAHMDPGYILSRLHFLMMDEMGGYSIPIVLNEDYVIRNVIDTVYLLCFNDSENRPKQGGSFFGIGEFEVLGNSLE